MRHYQKKWWFFLAGPAALALADARTPFLSSLEPPQYPLGVVAGNAPLDRYEVVLEGEDDGLVPVESTTVPGMADFVVVPENHVALRTSETVYKQTIHFLRHGKFEGGLVDRYASSIN